jgi:hypothetical protein
MSVLALENCPMMRYLETHHLELSPCCSLGLVVARDLRASFGRGDETLTLLIQKGRCIAGRKSGWRTKFMIEDNLRQQREV